MGVDLPARAEVRRALPGHTDRRAQVELDQGWYYLPFSLRNLLQPALALPELHTAGLFTPDQGTFGSLFVGASSQRSQIITRLRLAVQGIGKLDTNRGIQSQTPIL